MDLVCSKREKQLELQMNQFVAKSNELITQTRSEMSLREMRLLLYLISKIKPNDRPETVYTISVNEFSKICGLKGYPKYDELKNIVTKMNRSFWIDNFEGKGKHRMFVWFDTALYNEGSGTITFEFNTKVSPYVFELKKHYTSYPLQYVLPMRSLYSIRLYELLKCHKARTQDQKYFSFFIGDLKKTLGAETYKKWDHFKSRVLEPAVGALNSKEPISGEINLYSDLKVSYRGEKRGRAYSAVIFHVEYKTKNELKLICENNQCVLFDERIRPLTYADLDLPGQMSMENLLDREDNL